MVNSADENYEHDTWLVASKLQHCRLEGGSDFSFNTDEIDGASSKDVLGKLRYLQNQGGLTFDMPNVAELHKSAHSDFAGFTEGDNYPRVVHIILHDQKFDKLYSRYAEIGSTTKVPNVDQYITVRLVKDGLNLFLKSSDGQRVNLNRFRTDMTPSLLLDYLLARPNTVIPISQLKLEGSGFGSVTNVAEKLRKAGFTETVKKYFLPDSDISKVRLRNEVEMPSSELEKIKTEIESKTKSE